MRHIIAALCCASVLAGCATSYDVQPVTDASETVRYNQGAATTYFDAKDIAVQVTPLGFNSQRQISFGVAVVNKTTHPINFGYENLSMATGGGVPIAIYDRATLERQARNRAMIAAVLVAAASGAAAAAAARNSSYTTNSTVYTPRGAYSFHSTTYDPALASANIAAATAVGGAGIYAIQNQLNATIAGLNGRILATTTINPGQSYGGIIVGDRLKGSYPQHVVVRVSESGVQHAFTFNIAEVH
jgi:hypothetical protein